MQKLLFTTQRDHSFSGSELQGEGERDKIYSLAETLQERKEFPLSQRALIASLI
jgi:hypothetical protein